MPVSPVIDIKAAIASKLFPTVMMWNRLEGRPRTHHFNRALKAEVRDALWMLTKQWQMGEFKADDAGSPVFAKVHISASQPDRYSAAGKEEQVFEPNVPLEVKAEQKKIPFFRDNKEISLDIRLQMGQYWLKLVESKGLDYRAAYIAAPAYQFVLPAADRGTAHIHAHKNTWQYYAAISGRCVDGYKLYKHIASGNNAADGIVNTDPDRSVLNALGGDFKNWFERLYYQPVEEKNNAWLPERLEYRFECSASAGQVDKKLQASEYFQGQPEWYVFDIAEQRVEEERLPATTFTNTLIPSHVEFDGMPNTRWWKFEDGKTNLGDVKPSTSEMAKLLLVEFGLVFANDWFIIPRPLPIGSLANIEGLTVKNNFGETTWIRAAEQAGSAKTPWSMFKLHSTIQNNTLFLAPTAIKVHESKPVEEIMLIRDEIANMVWAIETVVPSATGTGDKGNEAALRTRQFHEKFVDQAWLKRESQYYINLITALPDLASGTVSDTKDVGKNLFNLVKDLPDRVVVVQQIVDATAAFSADFAGVHAAADSIQPGPEALKQQLKELIRGFYGKIKGLLSARFETEPDTTALEAALRFFERLASNSFAAPISYLAMTQVPENWIPFSPVHVKDSNRETQLQRASMLRIIENEEGNPAKVKPQTSLLREGLEEKPQPLPYYIHEEEVPRAGIRVTQFFQRTRWTNGEVYTWLGIKKKPGRGEGSSGLAFDQIADHPQ